MKSEVHYGQYVVCMMDLLGHRNADDTAMKIIEELW